LFVVESSAICHVSPAGVRRQPPAVFEGGDGGN
jgi:hypothetical protein